MTSSHCGGVRFRVDKHQLLGGHIVDSIGLDVKVVVVADNKSHVKSSLESITVSDSFDELKSHPSLSRFAQDLVVIVNLDALPEE